MTGPNDIVDKFPEGDFDPEEVERIAATPGPPRFTDNRGMPIAVGDVVLVWANSEQFPDEPEFMGRVVSMERGFLQVQDGDGNVLDQYPDAVEIAPRDQWYRVESEDFSPEEVEQIAHTPTSVKDLGFEPCLMLGRQVQKWRKELGWQNSGRYHLNYWVEVYEPDPPHNYYRVMVQSVRRNLALPVASMSYELLGWKDTNNLLDVQSYVEDFERRLGLLKEAEEPATSFEPDEVEKVAHAALRGYDASWFRASQFFYVPEDGTWYKEWHDQHYPGWAYRMRVIPHSVPGKWRYDVQWLYHAPTNPPNTIWQVFNFIFEWSIEGVGVAHRVGVRQIMSGEMRWETQKI